MTQAGGAPWVRVGEWGLGRFLFLWICGILGKGGAVWPRLDLAWQRVLVRDDTINTVTREGKGRMRDTGRDTAQAEVIRQTEVTRGSSAPAGVR